MKKKIVKLYTFLLLAFLGALVLVILLFALLQTRAMQGYVIKTLITEAKKEGISLEIDSVEGVAPFNWSLGSVKVATPGNSLSMEGVQLEIAFFPLLQKKLTIRSLTVDKMAFAFSSSKQRILFSEMRRVTLPFDFATKTLEIRSLTLHDLQSDALLLLSISGKARLSGNLQEMELDLLVEEPLHDNTFKLDLLSSKKKDTVRGDTSIVLKETKALGEFFTLAVDASLRLKASCLGKWSFWPALEKKSGGTPLSLSLSGDVDWMKEQSLPFLNRSWSLQGDFFLWPDLSSYAKSCSLESDWIRLRGRASFSPKLKPLTGSAVLTLKELSELAPLLSYPLSGEVVVKAALSHTDCIFSAKSPSLGIGEMLYSPATCTAEASLGGGTWQGKALASFINEALPWKGSLEFSLDRDDLSIEDVLVETTDTKVSGSGYVNMKEDLWDASLFFLGENLRPFRALFPSSDLEGSLGGDLSLTSKQGDLSISSHLLLKNIRYQSSLVDSISVEADIFHALSSPTGSLLIDCDNLFVKGGELEKLHLLSQREAGHEQTYTLTAFGEWKEPFSISSKGTWNKAPSSWRVEVKECAGRAFTKPFSMKPFSVSQTDKSFLIDEFSLSIGDGYFDFMGSLEESKVEINTKAKHLPLDLVSLFYPSITLSGIASFEGNFLGSEEKTGGSFLATLEQASFSHVKAKGALQMHASDTALQIHSHIYATKEQFFDWTATLPLNYSYAPFSVTFDEKKPVASEVTMQGAIEELFDFLQTGSHKTSGWVTSHLFLSGNLESPFLLGESSLQSGRYENYITGTRLQEIDATIVAGGNTLKAEKLSCKDKKGGSGIGSGTLFLKPSEHFPFELSTELCNLQIVGSEMLELMASGNLLILGNKEKARASGTLSVDEALFSIADSLPAEVPVLPVKHINKPIHLQRSEVIIPPNYPLTLDVTLHAKDRVIIKGKGLNSEWAGDLDITGTPLSPTAKGSLTLRQGEFKFSGKTFSLLSGDLSFSDQAGQNGYLKIQGQLQLQDTMITALLQGPLDSPRLTFQSSPALPTSSILSLILFNKDISDITPMQTIQLAQVIVSLSGSGGPDVLEALRKGIGVDRLSVEEKDGTEELAIQIGWQIAKGITVSLSQSKSSSDIKVEVDLKNGFIFEAETQNQEEGKFSLKWNKNY